MNIIILLSHAHQKEVSNLFPDLFVEKSNIKIMVNKCMRPSWIYGKLVSFHKLDFIGFLLCFSFVYSALFGALFLVIHWILIDLIIYIIQVFFL